ncbi:MAG: zinc-ribbon domain-containing protein [Anaeromyxobacteraceae bacterium]
MLIRCEKCSTVYELDEKVLPPGGAPVQCSRCQYIFTAHPSSAPNGVFAPPQPAAAPAVAPAPEVNSAIPAPTPAPAAPASAAPARETHPPRSPAAATPPAAGSGATPSTTPPPARSTPLPAPRVGSAAPSEGPRTSDGRLIRKVPFPDDDAPAGPPRPLPRMPVDVPPRAGSRSAMPWIVALALLAAVAAAVAAWKRSAQRVDPAATEQRAAGLALLVRDDRASLASAVVKFEDAERVDPRLFQARADRDLSRALVLGLVQVKSDWLAARSAALDAAAQGAPVPVGPLSPEEAARVIAAAEVKRLRTEGEAVRARALQLESDATADVAALLAAHPADPAVLRAAAVLAAPGRDPSLAGQAVRRARAGGVRDAWVDLAEAAAQARAATPERRAEGVARLETFARAHPELLRARFLLAAANAVAGRAAEARRAADAVLAANPAHEDARELRDELVRGAPGIPAARRAVPGADPPAPPAEGAAPSLEQAAPAPEPGAPAADPAAADPAADSPAGTAVPSERKSVSHAGPGAEQ